MRRCSGGGGRHLDGGCLPVLLAGLVLAWMTAVAAAQQEMVPEARQVLHGYRAVITRMPVVAQQTLNEWLGEWPVLEGDDRKAIIDLLERLRYIPGEAVEEALRDVPQHRRRQALLELAADEGYFRGEAARAMVVVAGVGAPAEVTVGEGGPWPLRRTWRHVRPNGLLLRQVVITGRNRSHPGWAGALMCGRFEAVGPDGRVRHPTLFEALRKARGLPPTAAWLVTSGTLLARADYSTHAGFGTEFGPVQVSSDLFRLVARRRAEYVERSVRRGVNRPAAAARARVLGADQLGLDRLYPDAALRAFVWDRMQREPGVQSPNTFIYITALRAIHQYRPHLMVVCFGEPGEEFREPPAEPRRSDARSEADYQNRLRGWRQRVDAWREALPRRRQEALVDLDVHIDYLFREFRRNPFYGPRGMFVLVLGDPAHGTVQVVIVSAGTRSGTTSSRGYGIIRLAPTLAKFLDVPLPLATGSPVAEAFAPQAGRQPAPEAPPPGS